MVEQPVRRGVGSAAIIVVVLSLTACQSPRERSERLKLIDSLRVDVARLERGIEDRDASIARLKRQIETLQAFDDDRPVDLFAPVKIEIVSRSGGANYDGKPGDDGVTVHIRPVDADGDAVKVPGRITVQLVDMSVQGSPAVLGVCEIGDPDKLRRSWHSRFATEHYTVKCPFSRDMEIPVGRKVTVHAEFVDFLSGATLTAVTEVGVSCPGP